MSMWFHDRESEPIVASVPGWLIPHLAHIPRPCGCESSHCTHPYLSVPAGSRKAIYVGAICDQCADTHMSEYLTD